MRRYQHPVHAQLLRDVAGVERSAAAEGDQREVARVVAAPDRVLLDGLDHRVGLDLQRVHRRLLHAHVQLRGQVLLDRAAGGVLVELHPSAEQLGGGDAPEHQLAVGGGRLRAAAAVAGRPGVRPGRARANLEHAARVHVCDRAAARTDRVELDHRDHRVVLAHAGVEQVAHPHLAARRHADVGRRAPHVQADHARRPGRASRPDAADQARDRSREERGDGLVRRALLGQYAAGRAHQVQLRVEAASGHLARQPAHVAAHLRADVGVQAHRGEALVLAVLGEHLVAHREERLRELLEHDLLGPPLVIRVQEREEEADRD